MFELRFKKEEIPYWADQYVVGSIKKGEFESETGIIEEIAPRVQARGYYTREEFEDLCRWKTKRTRSQVQSNPADTIEECTRMALSTPDERLRIGVLTLLNGVSWPTASVLLHFGFNNLYPILDFRALWSLGLEKTPSQYKFDLWDAYTHYCRHLAAEANVSMRTLDRALWAYSQKEQKSAPKENQ